MCVVPWKSEQGYTSMVVLTFGSQGLSGGVANLDQGCPDQLAEQGGARNNGKRVQLCPWAAGTVSAGGRAAGRLRAATRGRGGGGGVCSAGTTPTASYLLHHTVDGDGFACNNITTAINTHLAAVLVRHTLICQSKRAH